MVRKDLFAITILSFASLCLTERYHEIIPTMPLTVPACIGTAISILLSFNLSQSYDRWWEARKLWGSIVNDSRSLVIQLLSFVDKEEKEIVKKISFRQIAWAYCLGRSLRKQDPMKGLEEFLSESDIEAIQSHDNKPLAILLLHGQDLRSLEENKRLALFAHTHINTTLVRLCDSQGATERIKNTVFPVMYQRFLHLSIYFFVLTLSISLESVRAIFEVPLLIGFSITFFSLERAAWGMQDPFENKPMDTPVTAIATNIERNIKQLLGEVDNLPQPFTTNKFYLL